MERHVVIQYSLAFVQRSGLAGTQWKGMLLFSTAWRLFKEEAWLVLNGKACCYSVQAQVVLNARESKSWQLPSRCRFYANLEVTSAQINA